MQRLAWGVTPVEDGSRVISSGIRGRVLRRHTLADATTPQASAGLGDLSGRRRVEA
jgi:hypothetical protein